LFQKRFTGGEENSLSHEEQEAFNVFLRLLLSISDIHHEYVAFIAPVLDTTVSDEQNDLWNVNENGLEPSLFAIKRNSVVNLVGDGKHALFNQRLKFWKIDDDSNYFYPSFEACKHLAVALGYAQWEKNERATDLATLRLQDGFPNWDPNRDHPADKNPPAQTELYGLQFLRWQAVPSYFQGPFGRESYYIDTRQVLRYANINVWGEHIDGEGAPRQVPAPDMFKRYFVPDQIAKHADPIQKALYTAVYPDGPAHVRTIYQIRGELIRAKNDLRQWDDLEQRQRQGDLPNDDISSLMALLGKYPDGKDAIERTIHNLTTELAETGV
jgi:hypothetical protein